MKKLTDYVVEHLQQIDERYSQADERLFWKWVDDLQKRCNGDILETIYKSKNDEYNDFYTSISSLETNPEQFEMFCEIFFDLSNAALEKIEDEDYFGSDDASEYASWSLPFLGKKAYEDAFKKNEWEAVCDEHSGEHAGYVMDADTYINFLHSNNIETKGYK